MRISRENLRLYAVTDRRWLRGRTLCEQIGQAILGGVTCVQLREKDLKPEDFLREAAEVKALCMKYGVPLIINDSAEIALRAGADGVHVGQKDQNAAELRKAAGDRLIIGVSAATPEEAVRAEHDGADYIGCGAVFSTSTKTNTRPVSRELLSEICASVQIPVVAIGGITEENAGLLKGTGIAGIAVVSAIFAQENIREAAARLNRIGVWK